MNLLGLENQVQEHEEKLRRHDREIGRISDEMVLLQKSMNESLIRNDESNKFLRDQITRQSEQNQEILSAVLNRNSESEKRQHELKMLDRTNIWKFVVGGGASAGVVFTIIRELLAFFK